jgi:subtilisin family serine protease
LKIRTALAAFALLLAPRPGAAQVDLSRALPAFEEPGLPALLSGKISVLTESPVPGAVSVGPRWYALESSASDLRRLLQSDPKLVFSWSPPRRLLLDRANGWIRTESFRAATNLSGRGVVVGVIDSGIDVTHPDLMTADGKTRVRYWLDFSRGPAGKQPELEEEYGCTSDPGCAILSGDDIDELLSNGISADEPRDTFGHGTHVASLAAGNGLANDPPRYVGVAPEATLVVARVARSGGGGIFDADVLKAARFLFEQAEALGMPAVANLSLGSDFGAHDGSSGIEQGLSDLVGPSFPGRAIVVAAGNSAGLYAGVDENYPDPLGIHTEVHVPRGGEALVPIYTPLTRSNATYGTVYVWIQGRPGDELEVGLDDQDGQRFPPLPPGEAGVVRGDAEITVINQSSADGLDLSRGSSGTVLIVDGHWSGDTRFAIRLEGHGTARIWVQSEGELAPEVSVGALFPRAFKQGTINVPAAASDLISVGATLNRTQWVDWEGFTVSLPQHGALDDAPEDTTAFFSAAGPNELGVMKPELVAPGANVIGAMSSYADPRNDESSLFGSFGRCGPGDAECFVVDDFHAVTGGTSMSAPIVSGAIALLLERDPTLDQLEIRALLQSGVRRLDGITFAEEQVGAGALDLEGILLAQIAGENPSDRVPSGRSYISLSSSYARPDGSTQVQGLAELRDVDGAVVDGFEPSRLGLRHAPAELDSPLRRIAPGLYSFALIAPAGSGGADIELELLYDDAVIVSRRVPIAVDRHVATEGLAARGGCAFARVSGGASAALLGLLFALALGRARLRYRRTK